MDYKIVSDSSADILKLESCNFSAVPLKIITDEKEYIDNASLDINGMISDLQKYRGVSKSSCPNFEEWKAAFEDYDAVFCVAITGSLSGSYNAAKLAVEEYLSEHPERKGFAINSLSTGPENVLIIEKLSELIAQGRAFDDIVAQINEYMNTTHLLFCLESLQNLANNGRVSKAVAKIAGILGIRIIGKASLEGTLEIGSKVRGAQKAIEGIFDELLGNGYCGGKIRIHHCQNPEAAQTLSKMIKEKFPKAEPVIDTTGALCSFYAESGGLLVGFEGAEKR